MGFGSKSGFPKIILKLGLYSLFIIILGFIISGYLPRLKTGNLNQLILLIIIIPIGLYFP